MSVYETSGHLILKSNKNIYRLLPSQLDPNCRDGGEIEDEQRGRKGRREEARQGGGIEQGKLQARQNR